MTQPGGQRASQMGRQTLARTRLRLQHRAHAWLGQKSFKMMVAHQLCGPMACMLACGRVCRECTQRSRLLAHSKLLRALAHQRVGTSGPAARGRLPVCWLLCWWCCRVPAAVRPSSCRLDAGPGLVARRRLLSCAAAEGGAPYSTQEKEGLSTNCTLHLPSWGSTPPH